MRHKRGTRCDIEVAVTSSEELYAQAERAKSQKKEEKSASSGGAEKDPEPEDGASARWKDEDVYSDSKLMMSKLRMKG